MDKTVTNFYTKNAEQGYGDDYSNQHRPRWIDMIEKFNLNSIHNNRLGDFGAGKCGFFALLPQDNEFHAYDGADLKKEDLLCNNISYEQVDLDRNLGMARHLDISFCLEVCEHCASPFRLLDNIKSATKIGGDVYISVPDERMWHPVIYYQLFYPHTNFMDFLSCMALPVKEYYLFDKGWPSWIFKCENRPWSEKLMKFVKTESKFRDANLLEVTNL